MFTRRIPCSQEESRVHKKNPVFLQSLPAQAWNIRVIRVIRVQKKNLVSSSPFPRKRGTFVLFELFVFKRRISCPPVLSRASVEHSCYSRYSCSKEESRVHKKNLVSSSPFSRKRRKFVLFELFVFTRKLSVFPSACKNNKNTLILQAIMRKITHIIIHCTATRADRSFSVQSLEASHKARGFITIGYHYYITRDGQVHPCRPE